MHREDACLVSRLKQGYVLQALNVVDYAPIQAPATMRLP